jgi:hypothetical protein
VLVNVYVDGFNLYYGCLKDTPYKWLDLDALCRRMLPRHRIHRIRYFTARVSARPDKPGCELRQTAYLRALATIPNLTVHLGRFSQTNVRMRLTRPVPNGPRTVEVIKTEEKRSDVNLGAYLVADAARSDCDAAVMITNDSDLAEPIYLARDWFKVPVGIINPSRRGKFSTDLLTERPLFTKRIRSSVLQACQFPDQLRDGHGVIRRPAKW